MKNALIAVHRAAIFTAQRRTMPLIKLDKANEQGQSVGEIYINTDQIISMSIGLATTEIQMADGRSRWVKQTPDEVSAVAKGSG